MNPSLKFAIAFGIIISVIIVSMITHTDVQTMRHQNTSTDVLRIGYFTNINHAQAVIGIGNGDYQKTLGNVKIESQVFNAGPSTIEALFANRIDIAYVGPNPAINGYLKSDGQGLRVIAGASSGGTVFVIRNDSGISTVDDFAGKKFASPQLGNTQDVALRSYLLKNGYKTTENGGSVTILPAKTADIVTMMLKKEIDGAWVPEPWGAILTQQANCKVFLDERDLWPNGNFTTALIVVRTDFLNEHPEIVQKLLEAHVKETIWIKNNKDVAIANFNEQVEKLTGKTITIDVLDTAFSRMTLTYDPVKSSVEKSANDAYNLGFLSDKKPDLSHMFDLSILNEVLRLQNLQTISN